MATIASLNVSVKADTQQFEKAMRSAASTIGSVGKAAAAMGIAAGAAAAAGLFALTKSSMESLDTLGKLSDSLGADVQSLRGFSYAAQLAGADSETFSSALQKMQVSLGGAMQGGAVAGDFERLGLSVAKLSQSDATTAFAEIADAIKELPSPAARADAAVAIFGKSAQKLMPLLMSGSEGMRTAANEFDALAGTMTRLDIQKIETANDNISKLGNYFTAVGDTIALYVSPVISNATERLIAFAKDGGGASAHVARGMVELQKHMGDAANASVFIVRGFKGVQLITQAINYGWQSILAGLESGINWLITQANKLGANLQTSNFFGDMAKNTGKDVDETIKQINRLTKIIDDGAPRNFINELFKATEVSPIPKKGTSSPYFDGMAEEAKRQKELIKMLEQSAKQIFESTRTPFEIFERDAKQVKELFQGGFIDEDTLARKAKAMLGTLSEATATTVTGSMGGTFKQIDTSLIDVTGLAKQGRDVQKVESPQFAEAVKILQGIRRDLSGQNSGATFQ